jgi:RNA polymerase sigma-70 factor (ECF subfamily)
MVATSPDPAVGRAKTDAELYAALAVDRTGALGQLYDRYAGLVYGLAMRVLGAPAEAEDLTQEIFLTLCTKCDYDPSRGSLSAFLVTLTRSRAIDKIRARTRKSRFVERWGGALVPDEPVASPLDAVSLVECSTRVRAALATLPDPQRRVIEMSPSRPQPAEIAAGSSAARHREAGRTKVLEPPRRSRCSPDDAMIDPSDRETSTMC